MVINAVFLKCPDRMSEQTQKCSNIMEFWSDIVYYILLRTFYPHKLMFGQTTAKDVWELSDVQLSFQSLLM